VTVNGRRTEYKNRIDFQVPLEPRDLGTSVIVELQPIVLPSQPAANPVAAK